MIDPLINVLRALVQFVLRIFILRPLALLCCMVLGVLITIPVCMVLGVLFTIPVIVSINPSFLPDMLTGGLLRVQELLPVAYISLLLASLLIELVYWLNGAEKGR
ncbi:hypothetical protein [Citrobacter koseri]|uniref:hypothetical protein n=1 Tax=Citrobacter koseri TaxID=545 RepID=UPI003891DDB6